MRLISRLRTKLEIAAKKGVELGAKKLAPNYRRRIQMGLGASGTPLRQVKNSTMDQPIRRGGPDTRIRRTVNAGKNPIFATGKTASSITAKRGVDASSWEVSSNSEKGDMILAVNAKELPAPNIKLKRDPMQVANPQLDIVEKEILKQIDNLFR